MQLSPSTELEILAAIQQGHAPLDDTALGEIKPEYFQVDAYQWLVVKLKERDWQPIAQGHLSQLLLAINDDAKRTQFERQLFNLYGHVLQFEADAAATFQEYLAYCAVSSAIVRASEGYKNSQRLDYMLRDIQKGLDSAAQITQGDDFKSCDFAAGFNDRMESRKQERDNPQIAPRILTGINGLDIQFQIKGPIIVNFLAPFKRYKSIFLNSLGFAALLQGFDVLHVTLENDERLTNTRYDSMFSLINYDRITNAYLTQDEMDNLRRLYGWMDQWPNRLKVVKGRAYSTTSKDIINEIERLKTTEGFVPDVIIVDYLNILATSAREREERQEQNKIVWELKNVADTYGCPIVTASQATRDASVATRMTMEQQGKSVGISQAVDLTIAIDQTPTERDAGMIILSPMFSRAGPITMPEIPLDADLSRMLVSTALPRLWDVAQKVNPYVNS